MNRSGMAAATLRGSYVILVGFVLMIFAGPFVHSVGAEGSLAALVVMYLFALGWQVVTVFLNPRRLLPWVVLTGYVAIAVIPLIGSLFRQSSR
jgi:hypothetical protein